MTKQAENSLALYKGQSPASIRKALGFQKKSVVIELMECFKARGLDELALKLSIGEPK